MTSPFHPGELAVQARAGVRAQAEHVGGVIHPEISRRAAGFLAEQRLAVLGGAGADGRMWASALAGEPGLLRAEDAETLRVAAVPPPGDPLGDALHAATTAGAGMEIGVLAIDLETRARLRLNGVARAVDGGFRVHAREVYWNCPKYIQVRAAASPSRLDSAEPAGDSALRRAGSLSPAQRAWIAVADTFFIATSAPGAGADVSHRGGEPGFVRVEAGGAGDDVLVFPDYSGNNLFNTLGNLAANPAAGLLFIDFSTGATLQLTGSAEVLWERADFAAFPGAERAVRFSVDEVVEQPRALHRAWRLIDRSPFNPPPPRPSPAA
jgi:predicted pyridoxine 5'-phosphate oxidase superfamily flavin-nucleotide-binding protein